MTKQISFSNTTIDFGDQRVYKPSPTKDLTVFNTGDEIINLKKISWSDQYDGKMSKSNYNQFVNEIDRNIYLGVKYENQIYYYKELDGTLSVSNEATGIRVGAGQPDGSLFIDIKFIGTDPALNENDTYLTDEDNIPFTDENNDFIL